MVKEKVIAYLRLSKEDGDDESISITNQRQILLDYAEKNNMEVVKFYVDDGFSGYDFEHRPDFNRLKQDLNDDKIDTILVKDLSRLGRHNARVQLFLENILEIGKRVIAPGDNYDTYNELTHDMANFKTLMNEQYVKEVSKKVRGAVKAMQTQGRWITSVPYGYEINPLKKGDYYVDDTAAYYIKKIFDMYLNGYGCLSIAKELTKKNIPTATMLAKKRIEDRGQQYKGQVSYQWSPRTVRTILSNEFYIGTLILGKTKRRSINGKGIKQPEEAQYVFENAHEAVIDKKTFKIVQELILTRGDGFRGVRNRVRPNIFVGMLYCADCGCKLTSTSNHVNTRYVCSTYNKSGTYYCKSHGISESHIKEPLIMFLQSCRDNLGEALGDLDKILYKKDTKEKSNIPSLQKSLSRLEEEVQTLITQKMREIIKNPTMEEMIDEIYAKMINEKYLEIKSIKTTIEDQKGEMFDSKEIYSNLVSVLKIFDDILSSGDITKRQIATIVDKIIVHEDGGVDIFLKGNLHELCTNYIEFKASDKQKIINFTIDFIEKYPDKFTQKAAHEYCRLQGCRIKITNYSKILQIVEDDGHIKKIGGPKQGYTLVTSIKTMREAYQHNIVGTSTLWLMPNNVTSELIYKINKWISETKKRQNTKQLF